MSNVIFEFTVAWVGANVTILPGINIHEDSIIAAGAVVTKDVPPHVIVVGTPARVIRELESEELDTTQYRFR